MNPTDHEHLERALQLAKDNSEAGGWPFSAVIVGADGVIAEGVNSVHSTNDPTDHGEIAAIRQATSKLSSPDLSKTTMYAVAPPCPMCLGAIILAKIPKYVYATSVARKDEALSKLPATQGLYDLVSVGIETQTVNFVQHSEYEEQGFEVFHNWNIRP